MGETASSAQNALCTIKIYVSCIDEQIFLLEGN